MTMHLPFVCSKYRTVAHSCTDKFHTQKNSLQTPSRRSGIPRRCLVVQSAAFNRRASLC